MTGNILRRNCAMFDHSNYFKVTRQKQLKYNYDLSNRNAQKPDIVKFFV